MNVEERVLAYLAQSEHVDEEKEQFDADVELLGEENLTLEFSDGEYCIVEFEESMVGD